MNIRPKTVRRLVGLLVVCCLITAAATCVLMVSRRGKEHQIQASRTEGMDAFNAGNYPVALDKLHFYVSAHQEDYDALYAFAVSRNRVETSNGRHLVESKQLFEQLHTMMPDDQRVTHTLLELYDQIGYSAEATQIADELLSAKPDDVQALRIKATALMRAGKFSEGLIVSQKLNDAAPLDLEGHILTLNLLRANKKMPREIVSHYQAMQQAHPDDPRFEMLLGLAYFASNDQPNTVKWLRVAATQPAPDADFVQRLSRYFDDLKLFAESRDLLERAAANGNHPEILKILIERFWQNGRYQEVVDRLAKLDPASDSSDPDLLAFDALSLAQLGKKTESDTIIAALGKRTNNNHAAAWALAIQTRSDPNLAQRDAIKQYQSALSRDRENAVIRCWIGEAYSRLGETDLAMQQWKQSAELMPSWAHPDVLLARTELMLGQTDEAVRDAVDAVRRAPSLVESGVIMALASYRHLQESPNTDDSEKLIAFVSDIQRGLPDEPETLPILVELQAKSGKRDEAIALVRTVLNSSGKPDADLLMKLREISREQNLDLEDEIAAKVPADASESARLALERAIEDAQSGNPADGLDFLTKAAAAAKDHPVQWKVALAQYRENIGDPGAKAAWIALGDAFPSDVSVQNLILKTAHSAFSDRDFYLRTIERVRTLSGDEAFGWRVAKARYLLTGSDKQRDSAEAVGILTNLVAQSPDTPEYRVLLAAGLINLDNITGAIEHLREAVKQDSAGLDAVLNLAQLLQSQGRLEEARQYLDRASRSSGLSLKNRKPLAAMLAQQGAVSQAVDVLKPVAADLDPEAKLLLAELLRKRGDADQAEPIYAELLKSPDASADAIAAAADFYAATNRLDLANQTIARLNDPKFPFTQHTRLIGRFDEAYVSKEAAKQQFTAATTQAADDAAAWRELVEFDIRQNHYDEAVAAADSALKMQPGDDDLSTLKAQAIALQSSRNGQTDLRPLIEALGKDPRNAAQVETLRTIQNSHDNKQSPTELLAKLKTIAGRFPNYYPLQLQLAQQYLALNQPLDAAAVAERLTSLRSNDPDSAKLAVLAYRQAQRWRDMKRAADRWRQLTLDHPLEADMALADACLHLDDVKSAGDQLAPYIETARSSPQRTPGLTALVARLFAASGKTADARALLEPLLVEGANWRRVWLSLAGEAVTPADTAAEWIRTAAAVAPDRATDEQFAIARAWQQLGTRLSDTTATQNAKELLKTIVDRPDAGISPMLMLASLEIDANELPAAEVLYRKIVAAKPEQPDALNNLAYIVLENNGDLNEAKDFATRAVTLRPEVAAFHDTLARIQEKLDSRDLAIQQFQEALRIDPTHLEARIGLARVLGADGKRDRASQELQRIDTQLNGVPPAKDSTRRELQSLRESLSRTTD